MSSKNLDKILLNKAVQLLAQRSHSVIELKQKLSVYSSKYIQSQNLDVIVVDNVLPCIDRVIEYCIEHNWLNDSEYIKQYIRMRSHKGYGFYRILQELKQRGLDNELALTELKNSNIDWANLALQQAQKKFRTFNQTEIQQKIKLFQFLSYRGFSREEISHVYSLI